MAHATKSQVKADNNARFSELMPGNEVLGAPEHMNLIGFKLAQPLRCLEPTTRASTSRSSGSYIHVLTRANQPSQLGACFVETEGVTWTEKRQKNTQGAHRGHTQGAHKIRHANSKQSSSMSQSKGCLLQSPRLTLSIKYGTCKLLDQAVSCSQGGTGSLQRNLQGKLALSQMQHPPSCTSKILNCQFVQ
jgi:hypothetical protein